MPGPQAHDPLSVAANGATAASLAHDAPGAPNAPNNKPFSSLLTGDIDRPTARDTVKLSCSRANFRAAGWRDADFRKPLVSVHIPFSNVMPCNNHLQRLADEVIAPEIERLGGKAHLCYCGVISDGITQGSDAMRYSLVSREHIADSVELMHEV